MQDVQASTRSQQHTVLEPSAIEAFRATLWGELLQSGDSGYDQARTVWNAMIERYPALIVRCAGAADVIRAVRFARTHNLLVSVRGGGHNVAGNAVCDGGLMIDLSRMKGVRVDPQQRIARAEPGLTWGELDQETLAFGLATTGGTVSHTGVAGLTLGGGLGWLGALYGFASDNLLSVDVVTAQGQLLTASVTQNSDLFWAIREGGGNFGIVTSFEFQLHPIEPTVFGGMVLYPIDQARQVLHFYRDFSRNSPDELTAYAALLTLPNGIPAVAIIAAWFGPLAQGEQHLEPVRKLGTPLADLIGPIPYTQLQRTFDAAAAFGIPRYWKSGYFQNLEDSLIDTIIDHTVRKTSPFSVCLFFHLHGVATRMKSDQTAFAHRQDQWDIDILAQWTDPTETEQHVGWARAFWKAIEPFSKGVYVNHLDADDSATRVKSAYGSNYERLVTLKNKYDPTNFFRLNNNIAPTA
jgi:FAD/FMN-containing dehydrogenase